MRGKKREYEWMGELLDFDVNDMNLEFTELPISSEPGIVGGGVNIGGGGGGSPVVDVLFHRVLLTVQFGGLLSNTGQPLPGSANSFAALGLLLTTWDDAGTNALVFDPLDDAGQLDAEWLWRYNFPMGNDGVQVVTWAQQHPQTPTRFDIPIRGGRGSRATEKRRVYAWVWHLQNPVNSHFSAAMTCSYLYSAAR